MEALKLAIIGAGSSYTPEIIERAIMEKESLPFSEIKLYDIDKRRLDIITGFCRRYLKNKKENIKIIPVGSLDEALDDVQFVDVQIRVGGNAQRILDEKIPLKYGVIGQETTGPGGMLKAFRTVPVMLEIARAVERVNPDIWIINYTNPTGIVGEAVTKYTNAKIAALCSGPLIPAWQIRDALGVKEEQIHYDYCGLNHLSFASNITIDGKPISDADFNKTVDEALPAVVNPELMRTWKMLPTPYFQYFFHTSKKVAELKAAEKTRGEFILELEKKLFAEYADTSVVDKPETLKLRGGGGYSEIAFSVIKALYTDQPAVVVVNVPNRGAMKFLPDDAVVEIPCLINNSGIHPLNVPGLPKEVWGLISAVKNYEQLTVEAAVTGSRELALSALLAHPLVHEYEIAKPMLDEMLEANKQFLPQFFNGKK